MRGITVGQFLWTALVAGILGAGAMEVTMWLIARFGWATGNMLVALGSMVTKVRDGAARVGAALHAAAALFFSAVYVLLMLRLGAAGVPATFALGLGIGFLHGMVVSLLLVWVVAEHHPLAEFQGADFAIGLSHLAGHVAFGGVVGLVAGVALP